VSASDTHIKPEDVSQQDAQSVLNFLNIARTAEEISAAVDIPDERDVGSKVAQRILDRRKALGYFSKLQQVADVPQVGPERFTEIVTSLRGTETEEASPWQSVRIARFKQMLYSSREPGIVGAIQLLDKNYNNVAWVWLHDQEALPKTYVFPHNGRVEMHFKVSLMADLIEMLRNDGTLLHYSIENQEAHLSMQFEPDAVAD
jgi:hypothetical protein|tara:strand:- start:1501 stop:2106 length:606 start_codon:yes stop_codon:yes gene_type:complete